MVRDPIQGRRGERAARDGLRAPEGPAQSLRKALRREEGQDHRGRRSGAGRAQDGQGVPGGEAPRAARRQDGGTPRQQGRDLLHRAGGGHAVHGRRYAGGHRAESAGRAVAHEHRADSGDPPGLGREGLGRQDRQDARSAACRRGIAQVPGPGLQRDRRPEGRHQVHERRRSRRACRATCERACRWRPRCSTARAKRRSRIS